MPNTLTVDDLKKLLKRKHKGRAKGIMARIEEAEGRADRADTRAGVWMDRWHDLDGKLDRIVTVVDQVMGDAPDAPGPPTEHPVEYLPDDIRVPSPGTPSVLSWPVVVDVEMTATLDAKGDIELMWNPALNWKAEEREDIGPSMYFGNSGMIYHSDSGWHAIATEWMRIGIEEAGTYYPLDEKFVEGSPTPGMPIGKFVAGFWRHTADHPRHHRRTNVSWFDPKTWERIEVPDFTVPAATEPAPTEDFAYLPTGAEYEKVNSVAFREAVKLIGVGSENLTLPPKFTKKRWRAGGTRKDGSIKLAGNVLKMTWEPLGWQVDGQGRYASLHMIYPNGDGRISFATRPLYRPEQSLGIDIFLTSLPYTGPGLCGFWLGTVGDHPHQRRTDIHPWRFSE